MPKCDVTEIVFCQGKKHTSSLFYSCYVTDLWHHLAYCMPCSSKIISEILPEIHTLEKCDFLKPIMYSEIS